MLGSVSADWLRNQACKRFASFADLSLPRSPSRVSGLLPSWMKIALAVSRAAMTMTPVVLVFVAVHAGQLREARLSVGADHRIEEADAEEAIATCDGDARAAIEALLVAGELLGMALEEARREAPWGYVRGRPLRHLKEWSRS